jgi:hypothetical protein
VFRIARRARSLVQNEKADTLHRLIAQNERADTMYIFAAQNERKVRLYLWLSALGTNKGSGYQQQARTQRT